MSAALRAMGVWRAVHVILAVSISWVGVAYAQDALTPPAGIDPAMAWLVSVLGPWGALAIIVWRALAVAGRFAETGADAVAEWARWRRLIEEGAAGVEIRHVHRSDDGALRVAIEIPDADP